MAFEQKVMGDCGLECTFRSHISVGKFATMHVDTQYNRMRLEANCVPECQRASVSTYHVQSFPTLSSTDGDGGTTLLTCHHTSPRAMQVSTAI